jgi:ubiquinone/menaquinone biosynthesis C-methylase UbiE
LSNLNSIIKLEYFGISPFEIEVIYNTLSKFLLVDEGEILVEESEYVSLLNIEFPVAYDEYFFQSFGFDNWQKIKYVLKEMKRRRGRKRFKITLSFCGISTDINSKLVFSLTSEIGPQFEHAIEKIEHIIDTIHIEIKNLESKRQSVSYTYDAIAMKWVLADII